MATKKIKPTKPHFFQPLLPGFQLQLSIPVSFYVKYLEEKGAKKAVLRGSSGKLWHVKVKGRVIEDDGWEEFSEEENLQVGDFLVFRLDVDAVDRLVFDVMVFDSTTCLRDYHPSIEEEIQGEIPNQFADDAGKLKTKKKDINFERKADSSAPQHPYFIQNLSSYVARRATVYIPMKFARANGLHDRRCSIVLVNGDGKAWQAHLAFNQHGGQVYINQSWSAFRRANSLKARDCCIFKLIQNGKKPVLKITRCPEELRPKPKTKKQPTRAGVGSSSKNPHVYVTVKQSYIRLYLLRIPAQFAKTSGLKTNLPEEIIIRNERGRAWTVLPRRSKSGAISLGQGWTGFARSNGIHVGDILKLELIKKGKKPVIRISGVNHGARSNKNYKKTCQKNSSQNQDVEPIVRIRHQVKG